MSWFRAEPGRLVLELHVQPGAARTGVAGLHGDCLKIRLAARAVGGQANACLIEFLAERLGAARRDIEIVAGVGARRKRVTVRGARRGAEALWPGD